jgi:hypothetical protein
MRSCAEANSTPCASAAAASGFARRTCSLSSALVDPAEGTLSSYRRGWIADAKCAPIAAVAAAMGSSRAKGQNTVSPCPACTAERRSRTDARGPVDLYADKDRWQCQTCHVGGDQVDFVSRALHGHPLRELDRPPQAEVRTWFEDNGWGAPLETTYVARTPATFVLRRPAKSGPKPAPSGYPPEKEVARLWKTSLPVTKDREVSAWLVSRRLDPEDVARADLARAVRCRASVPTWAHLGGRPWSCSPFRLVLPLLDAHGVMRSLRARCVAPSIDGPKEVAAAGYSSSRLVFACPLARQVLASGGIPSWWESSEPLKLVVVEGGPDFLTRATERDRWAAEGDTFSHGVIGIFAGSWNDGIAARVPAGARVTIRTDHDDKGDGYARKVAASLLARRCRVLRSQPGQETQA